MPGWLSKTSSGLGSRASTIPEPFEIVCTCGQSAQGVRREEAQRVECKRCGLAWFVLPLDVYPEPKEKKAKRKKKKSSVQKLSTGSDNASKPSLTKRVKKQVRRSSQRTAEGVTQTTKKVVQSTKNQKRHFTPLRLVILSIFAVVSFTGYWVWQANARDQARLELKRATEDGLAALQEGDFRTAARELRIAEEKLTFLNQNDQQAHEIRQARRQALAAYELVPLPLFTLINKADKARQDESLDEWRDHFRINYRDMWIVLQAPVFRTTNPREQSQIKIDFPLKIGERPVLLQGNLKAFDPLQLSSTPTTVVFAAQLADCRLSKGKQNKWIVQLRPETAFLWTDPQSFQKLGFHLDEPTGQLLQQQAQLIGLSL